MSFTALLIISYLGALEWLHGYMNTNKTDLISIGKYKRKKTKPIKKQPFNGLIKFNSKKVRIFMETFFFFPELCPWIILLLGFVLLILILFFISAKQRSQLSHGNVLGRKWLMSMKRGKKCCVPSIKGNFLPTWAFGARTDQLSK